MSMFVLKNYYWCLNALMVILCQGVPKLPWRHHAVPSASPSVVPAHILQPSQAVELDVDARDLPGAAGLGGGEDTEAAAGPVGLAEVGGPDERDLGAVRGPDALDPDRERGRDVLVAHEGRLGREGGHAQRLEQERADAVAEVVQAAGAVLGARRVAVVGDQLLVRVDDLGRVRGAQACRCGLAPPKGVGGGAAGQGGRREDGEETHCDEMGYR
jgi:hypothetical protein